MSVAYDPVKLAKLTQIAETMLKNKSGHARALSPEAFGRALAVTEPSSEHGRLLSRTLKALSRNESLATEEERAVWWLARNGQTPTPNAVAGRVTAMQSSYTKRANKDMVLREVVTKIRGHEVAAQIAAFIDGNGHGPTWLELSLMMDWNRIYLNEIMEHLASNNWIAFTEEHRSLTPGSRYTISEKVS